MRTGLLLVLLLLLSGTAEACQNFYSFVQNKQGVVAGGAVITTVDGVTVSVFLTGTTTLATIYSDANCATTTTNPLTSDTNGAFTFYATDGIYDLTFVKTGFSIPGITNLNLFEPLGETVYLNAKYVTSDPCTAGTGALAQIGAVNQRELVINKPINCGTTAVAGANLIWNFVGSGSITVTSPISLTINGPVKCPHGLTCFKGTGTYVFGAGAGPNPYGQTGIVSPTYGTTVAIDCALGETFVITATNNTNFTISNPTHATTGKKIIIRIKNTSGGTLGTISTDTLYKVGSTVTSAKPADTKNRSFYFEFDGTNWLETGRTAADVSN